MSLNKLEYNGQPWGHVVSFRVEGDMLIRKVSDMGIRYAYLKFQIITLSTCLMCKLCKLLITLYLI